MRKSFKKGLALVLSAALALGAPVAVGTQEAKAADASVVEVTASMSNVGDLVVADSEQWGAGQEGRSDSYKLKGDFDVTFHLDVDSVGVDQWNAPLVEFASDAEKLYLTYRADAYGWNGNLNTNSNISELRYQVEKSWDQDGEGVKAVDYAKSFSDIPAADVFDFNVKREKNEFTLKWIWKTGEDVYTSVAKTSFVEDATESILIYFFSDGTKNKYTITSIDYEGDAAAPTASPAPTTPAASGGAVSSGAVSGGATTGNEVSSDNSKLPYSIGASDKSSPFWNVFSKSYVVGDGKTMKVNFDVVSDMANAWENFVMIFTNNDKEISTPGAERTPEGAKEYAVIRADRFGWAGGDQKSLSGADITYEGGELDEAVGMPNFKDVMKDANVTLEISRSGKDITIKTHAVSKTDATKTYDLTTKFEVGGVGDDGLNDVYFTLTLEKAYIILNSVEGEGTATGISGNPGAQEQSPKKSLMFTDAAYKSGKVTGTLNAENATVEVQVGSAAAQKATVSGKTFSLNVGTVKAGTTIKITATAEGYMSATKTLTVSKAKKKAIKLSSVKAKGKKVTGKVSVKKATVKVKVGKAAYKKAKVSGKKFTLKTKKMKKGTKVIVKATKSGYKAAKKTVKAK